MVTFDQVALNYLTQLQCATDYPADDTGIFGWLL
jgi:hypothetical protein